MPPIGKRPASNANTGAQQPVTALAQSSHPVAKRSPASSRFDSGPSYPWSRGTVTVVTNINRRFPVEASILGHLLVHKSVSDRDMEKREVTWCVTYAPLGVLVARLLKEETAKRVAEALHDRFFKGKEPITFLEDLSREFPRNLKKWCLEVDNVLDWVPPPG